MGRPQSRQQSHEWADRPVLATVLRLSILATPLLAGYVVVQVLHHLVLDALGWHWLVDVLAMGVSAVLAGLGAERACRRLLPLPGLLRMTMVFPDRAPSRLAVAGIGASNRQIERLLRDGREQSRSAGEVVLGLISP
ncbi:MAG TPA: hypothetical protein VFD41_01985 [Actinomycetales bacterium]|nr:hypothetical protein [Actinomycetales bacterium]